jgi:molybdopterin synthase catalytic subunit
MPVRRGRVRIQAADFSAEAELDRLITKKTGGTVIFIGSARGVSTEGPVRHLDFQAFGPMAKKSLERIRERAIEKFGVEGITVIHRTGRIPAGGHIVLVAASAAHREAAFGACRFVLEELKKMVPIWKKERGVWSGPGNIAKGVARQRGSSRSADRKG